MNKIRANLFAIIFFLLCAFVAADDGDHNRACSDVHKYAFNETQQCIFVQETESCASDGGYINYVVGLYCAFQGNLRPLGFLVYVLWFLYLLLSTAVTSDRFFAPNLPVISDALHLSENIAGETLMALGNGAPDFFTSLVAALTMRGGDAGILYGTLLGSGIFVTTAVIATIIMIKPFRTMERPLLKDMIFYLCAVFTAFATLWDGFIHFWEAAVFLGIYLLYLIAVFSGPHLNKLLTRYQSRHVKSMPVETPSSSEVSAISTDTSSKAAYANSVSNDDAEAEDRTKNDVGNVDPNLTSICLSTNEDIANTMQPEPNDSISVSNNLAIDHSGMNNEYSHRKLSTIPEISTNSPGGDGLEKPAQIGKSTSLVDQLPFRQHTHSFGAWETMLRRTSAASKSTRSQSLFSDSSALPIKRMISMNRYLSKMELGGTRTSRIAIRRASTLVKSSILSDLQESSAAALSNQVSGSDEITTDKIHLHSIVTRWQKPALETDSDIETQSDNGAIQKSPNSSIKGKAKSETSGSQCFSESSCGRNIEIVDKDNGAVHPEIMENLENNQEQEQPVEEKSFVRWILEGLNPIEIDDWQRQNLLAKTMQILKAPVVFIMLLTNPVVDEEKPLMNWNRPLNSLHCIVSPIFVISAILEYGFTIDGKFPLIAIFAIIGIACAATVFFTSTNCKKPKYHLAFAFFGFVTTVVWIYVLANEIVDLLQCFGIALSISDTILGLTCLAWGNSLGDFINNTIISRQGYSKMAISSCYGGMLFNLLLGMGVPLLIVSLKNGGVIHIQQSNVLTVTFGFLGFELACAFIAIPLIQRFHVRRPFAIFLYAVYAIYIICAVLTEIGVLSPNIFSLAYYHVN